MRRKGNSKGSHRVGERGQGAPRPTGRFFPYKAPTGAERNFASRSDGRPSGHPATGEPTGEDTITPWLLFKRQEKLFKYGAAAKAAEASCELAAQ